MGDHEKYCFLLDGMLAGLARWLRFLGYRAYLENPPTGEHFFFLTTSINNFSKFPAKSKFLLKNQSAVHQLKMLNSKLPLGNNAKLFSICSRCNAVVEIIDKTDYRDKIPPRTYHNHTFFNRCPDCQRIYWLGDHSRKMQQTLIEAKILSADIGP